jgi:polar amino acid transport system substrate-binding protein
VVVLSAAAIAPLLMVIGLSAAAATTDESDQPESSGSGTVEVGGSLTVATKPLPPFVFTDGDEPTGFSIDYWNAVAERLGVETDWVVQESVNDILASTERGEVDVAIAGISITREREAVIDFSQPYYISGQQIVTRAGDASTFSTLASLIGSGTFIIPLVSLIGLVILVSHLVWWFERGHESDDFPFEYRAGIGEALWWSTVSVITGGEAVKNINTALSRLIAVFWMLVGLFLLAFVTARATSVLTVAELESSIEGIEDLGGRQVGTVESTASVLFLQDNGVIPQQLPSLDEALQELLDGRLDAVVFDAPVVAYVINQNHRGELLLIEPPEGRDPYGIALPADSELLEAVNAAVIEIGRDGTLDALLEQWFGTS